MTIMTTEQLSFTTELHAEIQQCEVELRRLYKEDVARVLDAIWLDSNVGARRYLEETTVPHGGE